MQSKIFLGTVLFIILFVATGVILLNEGVLPDQAQNATGRMQIETKAQDGQSIEQGALIFFNNCSTCHGKNGEGVPGKGPVLNPDLFTKHWPQIQALKSFNGTLRDFVSLTVSAGRPIQTEWAAAQGSFPNRMPTWGQPYGGPLTTDQVDQVVNFVMNWQAEAQAGPVVPLNFKAVGSDTSAALPAGDAARGQKLFVQQVKMDSAQNAPCQACHSLQPGEIKIGPSLAGVASRAGSREPGKTAEQYIRESIQQPNAYIVPDSPTFAVNGKSVMPEGLGNSMSAQDMADMIAYLLTLK